MTRKLVREHSRWPQTIMKRKLTINSVYINQNNVLLSLKEIDPWSEQVFDEKFSHLQNRAYDCMDYTLSGQMLRRFPETKGKTKLVIQFECIDISADEIEYLASEMNRNSQQDTLFQNTLKNNQFVSEIKFQSIAKKSGKPAS